MYLRVARSATTEGRAASRDTRAPVEAGAARVRLDML
jgi:hypothetical protein